MIKSGPSKSCFNLPFFYEVGVILNSLNKGTWKNELCTSRNTSLENLRDIWVVSVRGFRVRNKF